MDSIRFKSEGSLVKRTSLAEQLGISNSQERPSEIVCAAETHLQSRSASELWLNIGGKDFRLVGKTVRIGRAVDNDIILDHKSVSRYHALLTIQDDQLILEDLKSRNGVSINGTRVKRGELLDNDEMSIGDVAGLFFEKAKKSTKKNIVGVGQAMSPLSQLMGRLRNLMGIEQFKNLAPKRKKLFIAIGIFTMVGLLFIVSKPRTIEVPTARTLINASETELKPSSRKAFERCLEAEDLGNLRQAKACFKNLAQTHDVQLTLERIQKRQSEISELRYKEGKQALENYYYEVALQKFQEVLLISDDGSEYRLNAIKGMQDAEEKKKRQ